MRSIHFLFTAINLNINSVKNNLILHYSLESEELLLAWQLHVPALMYLLTNSLYAEYLLMYSSFFFVVEINFNV